MHLSIEADAFTHRGPRATNQDAAVADSRLGFALVADGMGGATGGEVASSETLAAVRQVLEHAPHVRARSLDSLLVAAAAEAQQRVCDHAATRPALQGMGSTLALVMVAEGRYCAANVGDSRVYLLRDQVLTQLSHDHSLVQERVDRGEITPEQVAAQPDRNVITRAIGVPGNAAPHLAGGAVRPGDRFLVTSDGVHGVLGKADLSAVGDLETSRDTARRLVQLSLERGTTDNSSVAVLRVRSQGIGRGLA